MGLRSVCLIGPIEALRLAHTANIFLLHFAPYHSINFHKLCRLCHITREQKRNSSSFMAVKMKAQRNNKPQGLVEYYA